MHVRPLEKFKIELIFEKKMKSFIKKCLSFNTNIIWIKILITYKHSVAIKYKNIYFTMIVS